MGNALMIALPRFLPFVWDLIHNLSTGWKSAHCMHSSKICNYHLHKACCIYRVLDAFCSRYIDAVDQPFTLCKVSAFRHEGNPFFAYVDMDLRQTRY
ncbi:hypothetical protein XELAEV_18030918mg [Xenopus laevis]|uniref:Uncharacterized protein n=1 Tax=Xenopus laevis TaxID=8355 RepID=A0A974CLM1_XENLA|nr:hypothetical protein XELAEV_18030918mg [Xenopus laevis]